MAMEYECTPGESTQPKENHSIAHFSRDAKEKADWRMTSSFNRLSVMIVVSQF